ncbi:hypothetical protein TcasGA2_TC032104 [Tribolium castaneum]|uniref:Uncharacterized protein n=1 Tax=Tribolium castaneum TaxID=7070 RepID=A0A139WMT1_TRICA|nr:hypothetical protein TcasGA2_TC032104 [Tribolium castaneum]
MSNVTFAAMLSHPFHLRDPHTHRIRPLSLSSNSINRKLHNSKIRRLIQLFHFRSDLIQTRQEAETGGGPPTPRRCFPKKLKTLLPRVLTHGMPQAFDREVVANHRPHRLNRTIENCSYAKLMDL